MAEIDEAHFFRYAQDPSDAVSRTLGKEPPMRPVVAIRLAHLGETTMRYSALVDSGSERVFAAPGLARELRVDLETAPEVQLGLGGRPRRVRFATVTLHLFKDLLRNDDDPIHEWEADVGFLREWEPPWAVLLGRDGFFNQFTVTMHGGVPGMVVEPWGAFDERFGTVVEEADTSQPRFKP